MDYEFVSLAEEFIAELDCNGDCEHCDRWDICESEFG